MLFLFSAKGKHLIKAAGMAALLCMSLVGSLFLGVPTGHAARLDQQQATVYTSATKGTIAPFGIADLQHPAAAAARVATTKQTPARGVRHIPDAVKASGPRAQASAAGLALHHGNLLQNFNGTSSLDSEVTNFGAKFEPPDQGLCVGNGFVVEPVNSAFNIYRTDGKLVLGPLNVNALFDEGPLEFTSDPRCYFDKSTHTWFAIILFIGTDDQGNFINEGRTDIAVNRSGDPTTPWTVYHLEANDDGTAGMPNHPGCPCLGDQPLLGIDQENVYISTNEFSILGNAFNAAQIYAISKRQLSGLSNQVHFVHFDNLTIGGAPATSVQPATTNGGAEAEFFMNSLDPTGTTDNRLGVWALTNRHEVSEGGFPTLSSQVITSEVYGIPPSAVQMGSADTLDGGDDRLQQTQFINGNLWGALGTSVMIPNDSTPRAGIAWFQVRPHVSHGLISRPEMEHQGYIASAGNYVLYPAIQAGPDHTAAVVFAFSGPNNFPSAAYAVMREGQHSFGAITIAAAGTGPYVQGTRWGDYSYATLDPDRNRFWFATEYIPPASSQTTTGVRNWGTRVIEVDGRS
ncbi:MAG TPA: hypothetical protein VFV38_45530 [Ktedonobacteraceae bacterium]|nr:hypothetical protein [Ktedonobacteraceae bacterium]